MNIRGELGHATAATKRASNHLFLANWLTAMLLSLTVGTGVYFWTDREQHEAGVTDEAAVPETSAPPATESRERLSERQPVNNQERHRQQIEWIKVVFDGLRKLTPLILGLVTVLVGYLKWRFVRNPATAVGRRRSDSG